MEGQGPSPRAPQESAQAPCALLRGPALQVSLPLRQRYSRHIPCRVRPGVGLSELRPLQVVLIISGNLSFLNWLTMVPSMACFDDATLGFLFPSGPGGLKDRVLKLQEETARGAQPTLRCGKWTVSFHISLGVAAWE